MVSCYNWLGKEDEVKCKVSRNGLKAQVPACEFTEGYWEVERGHVHTQKEESSCSFDL